MAQGFAKFSWHFSAALVILLPLPLQPHPSRHFWWQKHVSLHFVGTPLFGKRRPPDSITVCLVHREDICYHYKPLNLIPNYLLGWPHITSLWFSQIQFNLWYTVSDFNFNNSTIWLFCMISHLFIFHWSVKHEGTMMAHDIKHAIPIGCVILLFATISPQHDAIILWAPDASNSLPTWSRRLFERWLEMATLLAHPEKVYLLLRHSSSVFCFMVFYGDPLFNSALGVSSGTSHVW